MARVNSKEMHPNGLWRVDVIESERGWGQRVDETIMYDNKEEAEAFVKKFNAKNNLSYVPDYYEYATTPVKVL